MGYKEISKFLNKSVSHVHRICQEIISKAKGGDQIPQFKIAQSSFFSQFKVEDKHKFSQEQIRYLTSDDTLHQWMTKSLLERVQLFKRRYPTTHITVYKLRKLYREKRIRKKKVQVTKIPTTA